jgi:hypothetical protein
MTRKGLDQTQQHQVKQLIFECSLAKMSSFRTQQVLKEKLDVDVTIGWINEIKAQFKEEARKEYYRLLTDNFAYKHLTMQVMQQLHEIIKQQWDIVNNHKGKNDLIALKALSEVKESVLRVSEFYKYLPEVETNLFSLRRNREYNDNYISISGSGGNSSNSKIEDLDNIDIDKEPSLTEVEKEQLRNGTIIIVGRDTKTGELIIDDNPPNLDFDGDGS